MKTRTAAISIACALAGVMIIVCLVLAGCASNPEIAELNCDARFGDCHASLEQEGATWYVHADTECGVVTLESSEKLPFCGHKRALDEQHGEIGIVSCQACVPKRPETRSFNLGPDCDRYAGCRKVGADSLPGRL